jgi:hypothetical protein
MSHTVKIQTQFKIEHINPFKRALDHFGWKIEENAKARTYPGDSARDTVYPMVAKNPINGYDLGIKFNEISGEIELYGDFYDGSIAKSLGAQCDHLKQEYSCCVIEDSVAYNGYTATRHTSQEGIVDIIAE